MISELRGQPTHNQSCWVFFKFANGFLKVNNLLCAVPLCVVYVQKPVDLTKDSTSIACLFADTIWFCIGDAVKLQYSANHKLLNFENKVNNRNMPRDKHVNIQLNCAMTETGSIKCA